MIDTMFIHKRGWSVGDWLSKVVCSQTGSHLPKRWADLKPSGDRPHYVFVILKGTTIKS